MGKETCDDDFILGQLAIITVCFEQLARMSALYVIVTLKFSSIINTM